MAATPHGRRIAAARVVACVRVADVARLRLRVGGGVGAATGHEHPADLAGRGRRLSLLARRASRHRRLRDRQRVESGDADGVDAGARRAHDRRRIRRAENRVWILRR